MSTTRSAWVHRGFEEFRRGEFEDGGSNLYVNARGLVETIHRTDVNHDGFADIVLPNSHGYLERGPTWIYRVGAGEGKTWPRQELPNDSGWMSRIADVDGDGFPDLVVVNGENGVTSELPSYIYWGGPTGLTGERTALPTVGAYDVAVVDVNRDGRPDLIFPSAWVDHHNAGRPRLLHVYVQAGPRRFEDASEQYGLSGVAAVSAASADLNGDGRPELVVANYRSEFEYDTDSFVYWGTADGFDAQAPLRLPTHYALRVLLADLDGDGAEEILFCGGNQVMIYWNERGRFSVENRTVIAVKGFTTMFCLGAVNAAVADLDGDGSNELILATEAGVQIRPSSDLQTVRTFLPWGYASWVHAADLDRDGRPELIVSKYDDRISYETESAIFWNGPGGFSADRVSRVPTAGAMGCTAGDLDGDGRPEVVFNNTMLGPSQFWKDFPIYVYLGDEEANYGVHRRLELPSGGGSTACAMADLDLDGYCELVITTPEGLRIFPGAPGGPRPDRYLDLPVRGGHLMQVHVADFNRDGYLDLLASVQTYDDRPETMAHSSVIFYGSAGGFSTDRSEVLPTYSAGQTHLADVNRDGYLDILVGDKRGHVRIFLGGPEGYSPDRVWKIPIGTRLGPLNTADLNKDGWLDLIVGIMSHYERGLETFCVVYGGPGGFDLGTAQWYRGRYSPHTINVADLDGDGNLELLVSAYSSAVTRILPAQLFRGDGRTIDLDHPLDIPASSASQLSAIDLDRDGYLDLIVACHRNDLGHQVDSLIYWNGPGGISPERTTPLPGMGPHWMALRDHGNAYTREPAESYISPAFDLQGRTPASIRWDAEVPETTELRFQLRWAGSTAQLEQARWHGPGGEGTWYQRPGEGIQGIPPAAHWLQYRAIFVSLYDCCSPQLREVRVDFHEREGQR